MLIDHHQEPDQFDFMYSDVEMPATCQMVYKFIEAMGHLNLIDVRLAECIYTGILTDTGGFRYRTTSAETHRIVANLLEKGLNLDKIYNEVYDNQSVGRLKLLGVTLDSLIALPDYRTAYMKLTRAEQAVYGMQKGDTEGFVNYGLGINNNVLSVFFIEDQQHDFIKISFRSKGGFDVNQFARKHFNGGGHISAAGGRSDLGMEETIEKFVKILEGYKQELEEVEI